MNNALELQSVSFDYGSAPVLRDISLTVYPGEIISLVGRSGGGKTTLLNCIAGLLPLQSGYRRVGDGVGYIFQSNNLFPWMTVRQNIALGISPLLAQQVVDRVAQRAEVDGKLSAYPHELSGGQQQRVAIARAFARNDEILLMDEPFGALDVFTREHMQQWLLDVWQQERKTIIFVTHEIEEALFLSDRVIVLREGQITNTIIVPFARPRSTTLKFALDFVNLRGEVYECL